MTSKRAADTELTDRNWDQEEELEERGEFGRASENEMKRRVIKVARRSKVPPNTNSEEPASTTGKLFAGFAGFKPTANSTVLEDKSQNKIGFLNGDYNKKETEPTSLPSAANKGAKNYVSESKEFDSNLQSVKYEQKLSSLNQSVVKWITQHVSDNSCIDLTPVFKDYEKHLSGIEKEYEEAKQKLNVDSTPKIDFNFNQSDSKKIPFGDTKDQTSIFKNALSPLQTTIQPMEVSAAKPDTKPFSGASIFSSLNNFSSAINSTGSSAPQAFGGFEVKSKSEDTKDTGGPSSIGSLFKIPSDEKPSLGAFNASSLASSTTSTFPTFSFMPKTSMTENKNLESSSSLFKPAINIEKSDQILSSQATESNSQEESDEPPKVEFKEVHEPDAYYSVRCKLFYKKEEKFVSKGVGLLHFKKKDDKVHLLLRADTNLGNIILNIVLDPSAPLSQKGSTNVQLITVANPAMEDSCSQCSKKYTAPQESNECPSGCAPKPSLLLFKVKTETLASELFSQLKEDQKS